jgi:predicted enzyme related to lactoylglutathione lyase
MHENDAINWFEIPAADLPRATRFYEAVLGTPLKTEQMGPLTMALFPYQPPGVGGCVAAGLGMTPGANGSIVYLNAGKSLDAALARVTAAGGQIVVPKTPLPGDMGAFAQIIDSEGNRVGLHGYA